MRELTEIEIEQVIGGNPTGYLPFEILQMICNTFPSNELCGWSGGGGGGGGGGGW